MKSFLFILFSFLAHNTYALTADTDGDGTEETVYICNGNMVCIMEGSGQVRTYNSPYWGNISIPRVSNTDADGATEVIVLSVKNNTPYVSVIHDTNSAVNNYTDPYWGSIAITHVEDTDGNAGDDIVILATKNSTPRVTVIRDANRSKRT